MPTLKELEAAYKEAYIAYQEADAAWLSASREIEGPAIRVRDSMPNSQRRKNTSQWQAAVADCEAAAAIVAPLLATKMEAYDTYTRIGREYAEFKSRPAPLVEDYHWTGGHFE